MEIDTTYRLESRYKRETKTEMSPLAQVWCCITILALFALVEVVTEMPVKALVQATIALAVIAWANWIY